MKQISWNRNEDAKRLKAFSASPPPPSDHTYLCIWNCISKMCVSFYSRPLRKKRNDHDGTKSCVLTMQSYISLPSIVFHTEKGKSRMVARDNFGDCSSNTVCMGRRKPMYPNTSGIIILIPRYPSYSILCTMTAESVGAILRIEGK